MANVLIVEDNVDLANVVKSLLEFEEHLVDVCHHGNEGLHRALTGAYDLAILDWDLPAVSGLEILTQLRSTGAKTAVIMLTGKADIDDKETGFDCGADDYVTKPFNIKELGARVRAQLRHAAAAKHSSIGDIIIDEKILRASKGAKTVVLTSDEYEVLRFAAHYPHLQSTVNELSIRIFKNGSQQEENKFRLALRRLRKKLDPTGSIIFPSLKKETIEEDLSKSAEDALISTVEDPLIGTLLDDKYEIERFIGGGGSGLVYQACELKTRAPVAVKMLHGNIALQSDSAKRFYRESEILSRLSHANIVTVSDFGVSQARTPFIVMELLHGQSLDEAGSSLTLKQIVKVFFQVACGLSLAHQHGLVHRDIKPSNLMILREGSDQVTVKIIDFGLARMVKLDGAHANITQTGEVLGSPPYMSPEQCRGEEIDTRSDIYSFGCAFYEVLSGAPPFTGGNAVEILVKHVMEPVPYLHFNASLETHAIYEPLRGVVERCLQKSADDRFQSAAHLKTALDEILSKLC